MAWPYTTTDELLPLLSARLAVLTGLSADAIKVVGDFSAPKMVATRVLQLWPTDVSIDSANDAGAGRYVLRLTETLLVICSTQLLTDTVDSAANSFMDASLGLYPLRSAVFGLHDFFPVNSDGMNLTSEPVKIVTGQQANKPRAPRYAGWASCVVAFSLVYKQSLSPQTDP